MAQQFAQWVDDHADFVRVAPAPFSVVCFRWEPAHLRQDADAVDRLNAALLEEVNRTGEVFISHTKLYGRYVLRLAIGHERTTIAHVGRAWTLLQEAAQSLSASRQISSQDSP